MIVIDACIINSSQMWNWIICNVCCLYFIEPPLSQYSNSAYIRILSQRDACTTMLWVAPQFCGVLQIVVHKPLSCFTTVSLKSGTVWPLAPIKLELFPRTTLAYKDKTNCLSMLIRKKENKCTYRHYWKASETGQNVVLNSNKIADL